MGSEKARDERRRHPRGALDGTAVLLPANEDAAPYLVENLSAGGALLVGDPRLEPGERVKMLLSLPGRTLIAVTAEVLRRYVNDSEEHLFAVAFRHLSLATEEMIQRLVLPAVERLHAPQVPDVLVIDDSLHVCRALERDLRSLGRLAISASTPREAEDRLDHSEHHVDTAIVDLRLGPADGLDFLTFLSERHPGIRRILMSGDVRPCQLELAVTSGRAHLVLDKPWSRETLAKILERPG